MSRSGIAKLYSNVIFTFRGITTLFSIVAVSTCISSKSMRVPFLHILNISYLSSFWIIAILTYAVLSPVCVFGHEAGGVLASQPGLEPVPPAQEAQSL